MINKKFEKFINRTFKNVVLKKNPVFKMEYKNGSISQSFDYELNTEREEVLLIVEKLKEESVGVITKQYIYANKLIDEMELEDHTMVVIALNKDENLIDELILNVEFVNNYLFHNRGIKFRVVDFFEFKRLGTSVNSKEELVTKLLN
ncbi:hypothetical protein [Haloplasma contractile]|uniref:Uncharacterized protein n=1 Tax=Haloplasma contractile SSD-17B TaxID=1033810 RepID=U2FPR0_9MOLU|nr:hypothetical protein [Haloplasma contractile]ERJ13024.1 hypothetical protein HLPCO_000633 [Haloplasma contractile SSD-17B]